MLSVLAGTGIGSQTARVAIPVAIVFLFVVSLTRGYVTDLGLVTGTYASAVAVSFICFSISCLVLLMAWRINRLEQRVRNLLLQRSGKVAGE